ncbi:MAG: hypothetical protein AB8D78_08760 [Akkermansiaceae bacterium]
MIQIPSASFFKVLLISAMILIHVGTLCADERFAGYEELVTKTHAKSLELRQASLRKTIASNKAWPNGIWGDNLWCLAALYLNEKTDEANRRLLAQAKDFALQKKTEAVQSSPENPGNLPWTFFSITDYLRILHLFHEKSPHYPGRLTAKTEAAMKEALWLWVRGRSRLAEVDPDDQFLLLGTENHDLNRRPPYYLITAFLKSDPTFRDRKLKDGHSVSEHAATYTKFFRRWPRSRANSGLWIEIGSNTYQKYSWPALFNLHELAPDPLIRERFGRLLDLAFIEEAQISVHGRRGGGLSRAEGGRKGFEGYKNLLFARDGQPAASSHSRVIETSRYQLPVAAILLDKRTFPAREPFSIRNRVLGKLKTAGKDGEAQGIDPDSALVNYAWRTPHYLLGTTLQNPALEYAGISRQKRWSGLLFDDPTAAEVGSIGVEIEKTRGGRPQHSFWSVQHENVLMIQRIPKGKNGGSYSTGKISMRFEAPGLEILDEDGWIFASNGKAFAAVKFLDGGHHWDKTRTLASPAEFAGPADTGRIMLHAGDVSIYGSFSRFRESLLANPLMVTPGKVDYRFDDGTKHIEMFRYDVANRDSFPLPRLDDTPINLYPEAVYQSPFLNGISDNDGITVTVGPIRQVIDFASQP